MKVEEMKAGELNGALRRNNSTNEFRDFRASVANKDVDLLEADVIREIIGAAIDVHRVLGPGLLESAYQACLSRELTLRNVPFRAQVDLPLSYKGVHLDCGYRIDLVVNDRVIVELKSVECLAPIHEAQLLTYLRLSKIRVGLLINFNVPLLPSGIVRRVL